MEIQRDRIAQRVAKRRGSLGLSLRQLAALSGVAKSTIEEIENGGSYRLEVLLPVAETLELTALADAIKGVMLAANRLGSEAGA